MRRSLFAVVLLLAACSAPSTASPPRRGPAPSAPTVSSPAVSSPQFCAVTHGWQATFDAHRVRYLAGEALLVGATSVDGRTLIAESFHKGQRSVQRVAPDRSRTTILRIGRDDQLFTAAYDGRYAVFALSHGHQADNPWSLYAWDSTGGAPWKIASGDTGGLGEGVVLHHGTAAWSTDRSVYVYDLAARTARLVRDGAPGPPTRLGDGLLWAEWDGRMLAAALPDGLPRPVPAPLDEVRDAALVSADAEHVAWAGEQHRAVWVWRTGSSTARKVVATEHLESVSTAGNLVAWRAAGQSYVGDLRSGAYAAVAGYASLREGALFVVHPREAKDDTAPIVTSVVRVADLPPLPACG